MKKFILTLVLCMAVHSFARGEDNVKEARLAGSWYPAGKAELSAMLDGFFAGVKETPQETDIGVIVSPHAGFVFSGPVAAYGWKAAQARKVSTVVVLAPTHNFSFPGASIWPEGAFTTPLGRLEVDKDLAGKILAADKRFTFRRDIFEGAPGRPENSVETQLPFIQKTFPGAKIVPVILGYPPDGETMRSLSEALFFAIGERKDVLIDVSVDQSHFHPDKQARAIDQKGLEAIEAMDLEKLIAGHRSGEMEVDGFHVVATAMMYAKRAGFDKAKVLRHATSADITGDASSVVGYASIMFYRDSQKTTEIPKVAEGIQPLNEAQKKKLLQIARTTVETFVKTGKVLDVDNTDPRLNEEEGAFVTLQKSGQLRGCIGNILGSGPLYKTIRDMAVAAASQDPRFNPVAAGELKDIDVEVSVLSKPRVVQSADEIVLGTHGVIVSRGYRNRGVFLPQVATETGWSKDRFLSELCSQKAGLPPDCWKTPGTTLEIFTAEVFGEKE
ncbi:MAG: AmmeMemoRadiSam system protein B [Candidatus Omnitrophica bacterium]|nr:AmmeMemoRadiSam system protein B [Candidatus Omnitrophota bacterium]